MVPAFLVIKNQQVKQNDKETTINVPKIPLKK